jgi:hypothetical protein
MRRLPSAALVALAFVTWGAVASCQPEVRDAPADGSGEYFPLVPDGRWLYSVSASLGRFEVEVTGRGEMEVPGVDERVFIMDERNLGRSLGFAEVAPVAYVKNEGYMARVSSIDYLRSDPETGKLQLLGRYEPTWMFPGDAEPGQTWVQQTDMFGNAENEGAKMGWSGTVQKLTSVSVPAGRFRDVLEVETLYRDASEKSGGPKVIYRDYYARGVGLIKSVTEDPSGNRANQIEQVLLEYSIP